MMTNTAFAPEEFNRLLDIYGADITAWPTAMRSTAGTWLVTQPEAQRLLEAAERQQKTLRQAVQPIPMDSAAFGRLMSGLAHRKQQASRIRAFWQSPRVAFASVALACMVFTGGVWTGEQFAPESGTQDVYVTAYNTTMDDEQADDDAYLDAMIAGEIL